MSLKQPLLGSQAVTKPQVVQVTPATCYNISLFKELMKEYRKLDDGVTMRLNRNNALFRDRERTRATSGTALQDEACAYFWKELVTGWKARTEIVQYCVDVVDKGMDEKRAALASGPTSLHADNRQRRRQDALLYSDEVKRSQIRNELAVERIVRQRSLEAFQSRCRYFEPPRTDVEARKWWDAVLTER